MAQNISDGDFVCTNGRGLSRHRRLILVTYAEMLRSTNTHGEATSNRNGKAYNTRTKKAPAVHKTSFHFQWMLVYVSAVLAFFPAFTNDAG